MSLIRGVWTVLFAIFILFFSHTECSAEKDCVSPLQFGLLDAKTDQDRFWVLYKTHSEAKKTHSKVVYESIDTIRIDIPKESSPIPLTEWTDFGNTVFVVKNHVKDLCLFSLNNESEVYNTSYCYIESKKRINDKGLFLLIVEDRIPWVQKRKGFDYGHIRKDIVYVNNGKVEGNVIATYGTNSSDPFFLKVLVNEKVKSFKNIVFERDSNSTYKTKLLSIKNQYNIKIENVSIKTPPSVLFGDAAIRLENCYKVKIDDVIIDGTYSLDNQYGYGISMDNVSDVVIFRLKGNANWGIFGNNNVNNARLIECDINRFDVHCYGRDVLFENCIFRNLYNQFSSMYGTVSFINCEFYNCTPVLFESSYNAYTTFDLVFNNCQIYASKKNLSLINGGDLYGKKTKGRKELEQQEYPNLYIDGLKVYLSQDVEKYYIYNFRRNLIQWPKYNLPGIKRIKGLEIIPHNNYSISNLSDMIIIPTKIRVTLMCLVCISVVVHTMYIFRKKKHNS